MKGTPVPVLDGVTSSQAFGSAEFSVARDGSLIWIAYESDQSGQVEVFMTPFPDASRKWQVSTGGGTRAVWNPNGRELFYRNGDAIMAVTVSTNGELTLGKPTRLFEQRFLGGFDVTPDGQRFVMVIPKESETPRPTQLNLILNWGEELNRLVPREN